MTEDLQPPADQVRRAVEDSVKKDGRVLKVLFLDERGEPVGEYASAQQPENPFASLIGTESLQSPPFSLEHLVFLAETHPVHSAALEQKTADIVGKGWNLIALDENAPKDEEESALRQWFESLSTGDVDMSEVISAAWLDKETVGWGLIELVRDTKDVVRQAYHVPGHTVRAHKDGFRLCQVRDNQKIWFRRWGAPLRNGQEARVDQKTGILKFGKANAVVNPANDLFVIKQPARRSTWYGIPGYISAMGWIALAIAARDDNLYFFANRREPRWAIVLTNLAEDSDVEEDLRRAFTVDLRQPHRNIVVPLTGNGKIDFQKLSDNKSEGSFDKLSERADKAIMIAHRVPAERLANSVTGPLGGNATLAATKVYKEGVVNPAQELLGKRLNRLITVEYEKATGKPPAHRLELDPLDIESDKEDTDLVLVKFKGDIITLREARHQLGMDPIMKRDAEGKETEEESELNDMLFSQLPGTSSFDDPQLTAPGEGETDTELAEMRRGLGLLLLEQRDAHDRLVDLTERVLEEREGS